MKNLMRTDEPHAHRQKPRLSSAREMGSELSFRPHEARLNSLVRLTKNVRRLSGRQTGNHAQPERDSVQGRQAIPGSLEGGRESLVHDDLGRIPAGSVVWDRGEPEGQPTCLALRVPDLFARKAASDRAEPRCDGSIRIIGVPVMKGLDEGSLHEVVPLANQAARTPPQGGHGIKDESVELRSCNGGDLRSPWRFSGLSHGPRMMPVEEPGGQEFRIGRKSINGSTKP